MKTFIPYERKLRLCEEIVKLSIYIDEDTQVAARGVQAEAATYWVLAREYLDGYVDPGEEFDPMSAMHVADLLSDAGMIETLKNNADVQMLLRMVEDAQNAFIRQHDKDHSILFHLEDSSGTAFTAEGLTVTAQTGLTESQAQEELRELAAKRENKPVLVRGRKMDIPSGTKEIAVSGDMNSTTVTFRIDAYYDGFDLSEHNLYVEMMQPSGAYDLVPLDAVKQDAEIVGSWQVSLGQASVAGEVQARIRASDASFVWQSYTGLFTIRETFEQGNELPPQEITAVEQALDAMEQAIDGARDLTANPAYIGDNGNWYVYDEETLTYVDSGKPATPQLTMGTVTTLAPGSQASATITGDKYNPQLNLSIPRGNTGDVGALTVNGQEQDGNSNIEVTAEHIPIGDTNVAAKIATLAPNLGNVYEKSRAIINVTTDGWTPNGQGWYEKTIPVQGMLQTDDADIAVQGDQIGNVLLAGAKTSTNGQLTLVCLMVPESSFNLLVCVRAVGA